MKVIADFTIVPIGVGTSVSTYVAECEKIIQNAGLKYKLHSYGTDIEGDWDLVFETIKQCHKKVHNMGAPRIHSVLKFGTRTDKEQTMDDKINSVLSKLE